MKLILIAGVARNRVIGKKNDLPWVLPLDLRHFMKTTKGSPLLMGRKVYESLPSRLPNRLHLVVSRNPELQPRAKDLLRSGKTLSQLSGESAVAWFESFDEALKTLDAIAGPDEIIYGAGGGEGYRACWARADELDITHIDRDFDGDVLFPEISENEWVLADETGPVMDRDRERPEEPEVGLYFRRYRRAQS